MTLNALQMLNLRPRNRSGGDCVVLALTFATGLPYDDVEDYIRNCHSRYMAPTGTKAHGVCTHSVFKNEFTILTHKLVKVYDSYRALCDWAAAHPMRQVSARGWNCEPQPDFTVADFIQQNPIGTFIVTIKRHAFVVKDGKQFDGCDTKLSAGVENVWKVIPA